MNSCEIIVDLRKKVPCKHVFFGCDCPTDVEMLVLGKISAKEAVMKDLPHPVWSDRIFNYSSRLLTLNNVQD